MLLFIPICYKIPYPYSPAPPLMLAELITAVRSLSNKYLQNEVSKFLKAIMIVFLMTVAVAVYFHLSEKCHKV